MPEQQETGVTARIYDGAEQIVIVTDHDAQQEWWFCFNPEERAMTIYARRIPEKPEATPVQEAPALDSRVPSSVPWYVCMVAMQKLFTVLHNDLSGKGKIDDGS